MPNKNKIFQFGKTSIRLRPLRYHCHLAGSTRRRIKKHNHLTFQEHGFQTLQPLHQVYLDDWVYDPLRDKVYKDQKCVKKAMEIRERLYGNEMATQYVNTYKWSVFKLQKEYPDAAAEVERYIADSKFFRGLFVVMLVLGIVFLFQPNVGSQVSVACFLLSAFSMIRYFRKRRKSTETAYQYIIFNEELNNKVA